MIWDICPINDEIGHLRARIEMLDSLVVEPYGSVCHLIAEGSHTHRGDPKPLHLEGAALPLSVIALSVDLGDFGDDWAREGHQRDVLGCWLKAHADPDDLVLSCDIDEHVNPMVIGSVAAAVQGGPVSLAMRMLYYGLDWEDSEPWLHPKAMLVRDIPESLSVVRPDPGDRCAWGAGWHVSYAGPDRTAKLAMFAHAEQDTDEVRERVARGAITGIGPNNELLQPVPSRAGIHPALIERFG